MCTRDRTANAATTALAVVYNLGQRVSHLTRLWQSHSPDKVEDALQSSLHVPSQRIAQAHPHPRDGPSSSSGGVHDLLYDVTLIRGSAVDLGRDTYPRLTSNPTR